MTVREGKSDARGIGDFTIEELEGELKRQMKRQKEAAIPTVIENPVVTEKLLSGCKEYIELINQRGSIHECEHFIFEAAVEAVFGKSVWKWINNNV